MTVRGFERFLIVKFKILNPNLMKETSCKKRAFLPHFVDAS